MEKGTVESQRVGKLVRAKVKQCYRNASQVLLALPEYANADYVEGIIVIGKLAIEHGWVEKDGVIVDPTLPLTQGVYFPGLRFRGGLEFAEALRIPKPKCTSDLPIFLRFGWGGIDSPEFRAASIAAYRHAGMEGLARQYEDYDPFCATEDLPNGEMVLVVK